MHPDFPENSCQKQGKSASREDKILQKQKDAVYLQPVCKNYLLTLQL